jgi:hypothetical protein
MPTGSGVDSQYQTDFSQYQTDFSQSQTDISQYQTDISQSQTDILSLKLTFLSSQAQQPPTTTHTPCSARHMYKEGCACVYRALHLGGRCSMHAHAHALHQDEQTTVSNHGERRRGSGTVILVQPTTRTSL